MIKKLILAGFLAFTVFTSRAANPPDEGMWMPFLISNNFEEMQRLGLKITPDQIYSVNKSSLKDAIVHFGGFCTGEIISDQGLILTNHHCGYDAIQTHSTPQNNILEKGFWAKNKGEEIPTPGLFVRFLVRMEDVTAKVNAEAGADPMDKDRAAKLKAAYDKIQAAAIEGTHYTAKVQPMYNGGEHYLFVYETFNDVRLVGTPPESVGKFGGDTDNWMWPRHTGDFSMFRVYSGADGKPAEYSKDNVPLKPRHFLPVSVKGVQENDFSMVFGYPGRTRRYLVSEDIKAIAELTNPNNVNIRERKLAIMKSFMDVDPKVRLQYATTYAQIANYWKKWKGELAGFTRMNTVEVKQQLEADFNKWVAADATRKAKYEGVTEKLNANIKELRPYLPMLANLNEAALGAGVMQLAFQMKGIEAALTPGADKKKPDPEALKAAVAQIKPNIEPHFKDYYAPLDKKLLVDCLNMYYANVDKSLHAKELTAVHAKYKGNFQAFADEVFAKSMFVDQKATTAFLDAPNLKKLQKDPVYVLIQGIVNHFQTEIAPKVGAIRGKSDALYNLYIQGLREFQPNRKFYPDANSTMRLTYGQIKKYDPADAVHYDFSTYIDGIVQKRDNSNPEFVVPDKLMELAKSKDFGRYGKNGKLPVCFISTNDITGGNSGSPVINGNGELIGLAFDGNWEAMTGDFVFEPPIQRTISVDIRFVLFCIDKLAGAKHIVDEMKLVE